MFLLDVEVDVLHLKVLSVRVDQIVHRVSLQVLLNQDCGVLSQILEEQKQFTRVNIGVLEPEEDLFRLSNVQQLPASIQVEHFVLCHVVWVVLWPSREEHFSGFVDSALAEETLDLLLVSDLAHDIDLGLDGVLRLLRVIGQQDDFTLGGIDV